MPRCVFYGEQLTGLLLGFLDVDSNFPYSLHGFLGQPNLFRRGRTISGLNG